MGFENWNPFKKRDPETTLTPTVDVQQENLSTAPHDLSQVRANVEAYNARLKEQAVSPEVAAAEASIVEEEVVTPPSQTTMPESATQDPFIHGVTENVGRATFATAPSVQSPEVLESSKPIEQDSLKKQEMEHLTTQRDLAASVRVSSESPTLRERVTTSTETQATGIDEINATLGVIQGSGISKAQPEKPEQPAQDEKALQEKKVIEDTTIGVNEKIQAPATPESPVMKERSEQDLNEQPITTGNTNVSDDLAQLKKEFLTPEKLAAQNITFKETKKSIPLKPQEPTIQKTETPHVIEKVIQEQGVLETFAFSTEFKNSIEHILENASRRVEKDEVMDILDSLVDALHKNDNAKFTRQKRHLETLVGSVRTQDNRLVSGVVLYKLQQEVLKNAVKRVQAPQHAREQESKETSHLATPEVLHSAINSALEKRLSHAGAEKSFVIEMFNHLKEKKDSHAFESFLVGTAQKLISLEGDTLHTGVGRLITGTAVKNSTTGVSFDTAVGVEPVPFTLHEHTKQ